MKTDASHVTAGFLPLLDAALLIIAREMDFARDEGIALNLVREISWANIRDRVAVGHFDMAHMLAPMPIAANLGLWPLGSSVIAPMALGLGGNGITVGLDLWRNLESAGAPPDLDAKGVGQALRRVLDQRQDNQRLRFAVVHAHSAHNYELRYWLAASGVHPDQDVEIVVLPPPLLPDALAEGSVDGYCAGEPWNSVAIHNGVGRLATVKSAIWRSSPEKVLGVRSQWVAEHGEVLTALLRALYRAADYCGRPDNHAAIAGILSQPDYLDQPATVILHGLSGHLALGQEAVATVTDFFMPHDRAATFPWVSHALWFYSQMVRWGELKHAPDHAPKAAASYRPDLYRAAISPLGVPVPGANAKVEGALTESVNVGASKGSLSLGPDGFFDGRIFDPDDLDGYIIRQNPQASA